MVGAFFFQSFNIIIIVTLTFVKEGAHNNINNTYHVGNSFPGDFNKCRRQRGRVPGATAGARLAVTQRHNQQVLNPITKGKFLLIV